MRRYIININEETEKSVEAINYREAVTEALKGTGFNEEDCSLEDVIESDNAQEELIDELTEMISKRHPEIQEGLIEMSVRELMEDIKYYDSLTEEEIEQYVVDGVDCLK